MIPIMIPNYIEGVPVRKIVKHMSHFGASYLYFVSLKVFKPKGIMFVSCIHNQSKYASIFTEHYSMCVVVYVK